MLPEAQLLKGKPVEYDRELYDRQFMSCLFRHAVVWLGRMGRPVDLLFYNALASSDTVMQQIVVERLPKFAFRCESFSEADFALIGAKEKSVLADRFSDIRPLIVEQIEQGQAALLEGDVFYFPHCPEYRNRHAQHVIVMDRMLSDGRWHIVDDDHASLLCEYEYAEDRVAGFFENSVNRKLRVYELDRSLTLGDASASIDRRFTAFIDGHRDSFVFYDALGEILDSPYDSPMNKFRVLHDCFSVLAGSRKCFAQYLRTTNVEASLVTQAVRCSNEASILKSVMARATMTGALKFDSLAERARSLKQLERELHASLLSRLG